MASFFRKLSDIFAGKYKKQPAAPDKTKPFWDVREAQSLEAAGFSAQESEAFVKKIKQAGKTGSLAVDMKDLMHIGQGCAVSEIVDEKTALFELKQGTDRYPRPSYFVRKPLRSSEIRRLKKGRDCSAVLLEKIGFEPSIRKVSLTNDSRKGDVPAPVVARFIDGLDRTSVTSLDVSLEHGPAVSCSLGEQLARRKMTELSLSATSASAPYLKNLRLGDSALTSFTLNSSDLGEACLETMGVGLPETLKKLSLTNRPNSPDIVTGTTAARFVEAIPKEMESLKMENIRFDAASEKRLGDRLKDMPALKEFTYNGPAVNDTTLLALAKGLAASNVERVDFSEGRFTDEGINKFLDILEKSGSKIKETGFLKKNFDFVFCPRRDLSKETVARIERFEKTRQEADSRTLSPAVQAGLAKRAAVR